MIHRVLLFLCLLLIGALPAHASKRALVIGNNSYDELPDLDRAVADARSYVAVLETLGYAVSSEEDLSTSAMHQAIGTFIETIEAGDEVAFIYAGHGWSDGSTNFIIGSDTPTEMTTATLRRAAIPIENGVNGVIDDLRARGAGIVLAVVDACRNNPFYSKNTRSGTVGLSRGLVLLTPMSGTFTVFSAGAGEEALDRLGENDSHPNSVFSRVFLAELSEGGSIQDIILDTAPQVVKLAESIGHSQRPAYYDGIGERYCLTEGCAKREGAAPELIFEAKPVELVVAETEPAVLAIQQPVIFESVTVQPSAPLAPQLIEVLPVTAEDPYFRPDPVKPIELKPAARPTPVTPSGPVQFLVRSASPIRTLAGLDRESICSVAKTPQQPTIKRFFESRGMSHNNRQYLNLAEAVRMLDRSRCSAIAVPPRLVGDVIAMTRDPSLYIVLPDIVR